MFCKNSELCLEFIIHYCNFYCCSRIVIEHADHRGSSNQLGTVLVAAAAAAAVAAAAPGPAAAAGCCLCLPTSAEAGKGEVADRPLD